MTLITRNLLESVARQLRLAPEAFHTWAAKSIEFAIELDDMDKKLKAGL
jgi:hypothetical protein